MAGTAVAMRAGEGERDAEGVELAEEEADEASAATGEPCITR